MLYLEKNLKKQRIIDPAGGVVFALPPPSPKPAPTTLQKCVFLPPGGRRHRARPHIAKAKATPHAMRFNMLRQRCLVASPDLLLCFASRTWKRLAICCIMLRASQSRRCARAQDQRSLSASSPFLMVFAKFSAHWALSTEGVLLGP